MSHCTGRKESKRAVHLESLQTARQTRCFMSDMTLPCADVSWVPGNRNLTLCCQLRMASQA